jgi:hypothetical protein
MGIAADGPDGCPAPRPVPAGKQETTAMQTTETVTPSEPALPETFAPRPQYEFNETQNRTMAALASAMTFVGTVTIILGGVMLLGVLTGDLIRPLLGAVQIIIGVWTLASAAHFRQIVDTRGSDIDHLMAALDRLRSLYSLQRVLIIVSVVLTLLALVIALILAANPGLLGQTPPAPKA